MRVVKRGLIT